MSNRIALLLFATILIAGCGSGGTDAPADSLTIGLACPMTGELAHVGKMIEHGVRMRLLELNAKGGVRGKQVKLDVGDDMGNPKEAANVAQRFASDSSVLAVIGHYNSSCTLAGKPIYKEAGVVEFSPASTNPAICKDSQWTFRNTFSDDMQGQVLARYAKNELGLRRVAVFYDNDDYGIGLKTAFAEEAQKIGLEIPSVQSFERDTADFRPQLVALSTTRPEAIFVSGLFAQASKIASQAREQGIVLPLLAGAAVFNDEYIKNAGAAADGTYVSTPFLFDLPGDRTARFRRDFQAHFGAAADTWSVLAYDAASIVLDAVEKAGPERKAIRDRIAQLDSPEHSYPGLGGPTYFDKEGNCLKPAQFALVRGSRFVPAEKQLGSGLSKLSLKP